MSTPDINSLLAGNRRPPASFIDGAANDNPDRTRYRVDRIENQERVQLSSALSRPPAAPPPPTRISFETPGIGAVKLIWEAVNDVRVHGYRIYSSSVNNPDSAAPPIGFEPQVADPARDTVSYVDTITAGASKFYWIASVNREGVESPRIPMHVGTPPATETATPAPSPWIPGDIAGTGGVLGGVLALVAGGVGSIRAPFTTTGSPPSGRNVPFLMPAKCWAFHSGFTQHDTDTVGATIHGAISKNITSTPTLTDVFWDSVVRSLATGPASHGSADKLPVAFEIGDGLNHYSQNMGPTLNATYPSWSCEVVVDGGGNVLGVSTTGQAAGNTTYQSIFWGPGGIAGEASHRAAMPAGHLKALYIRILSAQPAGLTTTFTFMLGTDPDPTVAASPTAATVTVPAGAGAGWSKYVSFDVVVANGNTLSLEEAAAGVGTGAVAVISFLYVPDVENSCVVGFQSGRGAVGASTVYHMPWLRRQTTTESIHMFRMARGGTLAGADCRLYLFATPGESKTIYVRQNGADSGVSVTIDTGSTPGVIAFSGSATFAENDWITLKEEGDGGGNGDWTDVTLLFRELPAP